ncbi:YdiY family protein [Agaribacterium sp. ZY112]|uniref:DUF481 domain-containing protein n=1 Tax=Agaribacterium sp. ZY112 TaxID=3233574 RepID=UPI003523462A
MKKLLAMSLGGVAIGAALPSFAEDAEVVPSTVEFGLIMTTGNTETSSITGRADIHQDLTNFRNHFVIEGLQSKDEVDIEDADTGVTYKGERTTAEKYFMSAQSDYKLNDEYMGLFGFASYEQDKFTGYEYQSTLAIGFSDRALNFSKGHLDYSVGPGAAFAETEDSIDANGEFLPGEASTNPILRGSLNFLYNISETSAFTQTFASDIGVQEHQNTKSKSETAITARIIGSLAMKAAYVVDHNTHVLAGKKHADTQTSITLVYSF